MKLLKDPQPFDSVLTFLKAHAETSSNTVNPQSLMDDAAFGRQRGELMAKLRTRIRVLHTKATTGGSALLLRPGALLNERRMASPNSWMTDSIKRRFG